MHGMEPGMFLPSPTAAQTQQVQGFQTLVTTNIASGRNQCSLDDSETFYIKLSELLESSGLTLIFNVRETLLDLYLVYLEVTRRGGYHQVGQEKKWGEVVHALKLEGSSVKLSAQLEKLYGHLLYQFEQLYFYRGPAKQAAASTTTGPLKRKWSSTASLSQLMDTKGDQTVTNMCKDQMKEGSGLVKEQVLLTGSSNGKEWKKSSNGKERKKSSNDKERKKCRGSPSGVRSAYQIFVKQECARLKSCDQAPEGTTFFRMAIDAWKKMSEIEKQPYVEESRKNREKVKEAITASNEQQLIVQNGKVEKMPRSLCDVGEYHVTSQYDAADNYFVNKAASVGIALKIVGKSNEGFLVPE